MNLWTVAAIVFILDIPFGYWRANERTFSLQWFLAIHIPVPFIIALRIFTGLGWQFITFPILVGACFAGQFLGGRVHLLFRRHAQALVTSCIIRDLLESYKHSDAMNNKKFGDTREHRKQPAHTANLFAGIMDWARRRKRNRNVHAHS